MPGGGGVRGGGGCPGGRAAGDALVASEPAEAVEDLVRVEVVTPRQRLGQVGSRRGGGGGGVTQRPLSPQARQGGGELVRRGSAVTVRLAWGIRRSAYIHHIITLPPIREAWVDRVGVGVGVLGTAGDLGVQGCYELVLIVKCIRRQND